MAKTETDATDLLHPPGGGRDCGYKLFAIAEAEFDASSGSEDDASQLRVELDPEANIC